MRLEILAGAAFLLAAAVCLAFLLLYNTPFVVYYWPALALDTKHVPAQATILVPRGFLNFHVVPVRGGSTPEWPTKVSWQVVDSGDSVVFAGDTNLDTAEDLAWRQPLEMRALSFARGTWRTGDRLKPDESYRLEVLSAAGAKQPGQFMVDMYYVAPRPLHDKLTCFGVCVRRRNPATVPAR